MTGKVAPSVSLTMFCQGRMVFTCGSQKFQPILESVCKRAIRLKVMLSVV